MKFSWTIERKDINRLKDFIDAQSKSFFVEVRSCRNLSNAPRHVSHDEFWMSLITCLLTTQQRSGPDSPISRFVRQSPFPLTYAHCKGAPDLHPYAQKAFESFGGIRRSKTIASEI